MIPVQYSDIFRDQLPNTHHHVMEGGQGRTQSRVIPSLRGRDQEAGARPQGPLPGRVLRGGPVAPPAHLLLPHECNIRNRSLNHGSAFTLAAISQYIYQCPLFDPVMSLMSGFQLILHL